MNPIIFPLNLNGKLFYPITDFAAQGVRKNAYWISEDCEIYSTLVNRYLHPTIPIDDNGEPWYQVVNLQLENGKSRVFLVHRILMLIFKPVFNCQLLFVNHINGIKYDDRFENMEWCTLPENNYHAKTNGLLCIGEDCPWAVLTEQDVREICEAIQNKTYGSITELARKYNCSVTAIGDIARGVSWKHISKDYSLEYERRTRFRDEEVHFMCMIFSTNKEKSFPYLYYLLIYYLGYTDDRFIRRRIYKIYKKEPNNFSYITSQYDY